RATVGYAMSYQYLFVVDLTTGRVLDVLDLLPYGPAYSGAIFDVALNEDGLTPRLYAWSAPSAPLVIFDLTDPAHPVAPTTLDLPNRNKYVAPIPGGPRVLVGTLLYDADRVAVAAEFLPRSEPRYASSIASIGVGGHTGRQLVAVAERNYALQTFAVTVYDVTTGTPSEIVTLAVPAYVERILVDRDATFAV